VAGLVGLPDGIGQHRAGRSGRGVVQRTHDRLAEAGLAQEACDADQGNRPLHEHQCAGEHQRSRVAEAVGVPQPEERVLEQSHPPRTFERLLRVVA
jgi:hypothetical protein